ncbi:metal dependent phosphohydrolase [Thermaerobacter marianensis DSM 12885]|uniref:Metal dependent phosphohydrolase n=1 Tax=Thermaerobacter marianensis (strain ATCC 700841 / DSM 12885 / JCM 10246 / 7p75a) TaxID=644966 RepID=E6SGT7_THEM7|nr:DEAD/DEAH box helicase family protein [Thermaerobacter marianensis]ADU51671.1 metal dependent phosphohydrolase [Thermaerobacter marianensis DSM 12885]
MGDPWTGGGRGWIPLEQCVARPPEGGRRYPLIDHLLEVARRAGDPRGTPEEQLLYLAGLLHDAGKARRTWQERLLAPGRQGPVGPHAFVGAALFAGLAFQWLRRRGPGRPSLRSLAGRPFPSLLPAGLRAGVPASGPEPISPAPPASPVPGRPEPVLSERQVLVVSRDIADHHGTLGDLETEPPWFGYWTPAILAEMDVNGLLRLVRSTDLAVAGGLWPADAADWGRWVDAARSAWGRAVVRLQGRLEAGQADPARIDAGELLRSTTARLIQADRFAVAGLQPEALTPAQAEAAIGRMERSLGAQVPVDEHRAEDGGGIGAGPADCGSGGANGEAMREGRADSRTGSQAVTATQPPGTGVAEAGVSSAGSHAGRHPFDVSGERQRLQAEVLRRYRSVPDAPVYTLVLPTGSGKTLTAMRVALEACLRNGRQRIVYVGPYLTVVEQAAAQFEQHTGLAVLQHHHLATPEAAPRRTAGGRPGVHQGAGESDREAATGPSATPATGAPSPADPLPSEEDRAFLVMESWQAPVVAVTFNQFFRALFPVRAQHALRIPALGRAFVILDEPQIIDPTSWALLTEMMVAACQWWDMQVLVMTATMPPWPPRRVRPHNLSVPVRLPSRYVLEVVDHRTAGERDGPERPGWDAEALAARLVDDALAGYRVAAILNTIADAQVVYDAVQQRLATLRGLSGADREFEPGVVRDGNPPEASDEAGRGRWDRAGRTVRAGPSEPARWDRGEAGSDSVLLVHGLMTPAHKAIQIRKLRQWLDPALGGSTGRPAAGAAPIAVATQALEAGVDLDFDRLYRARPVLPSVVQAAGRANRHGRRSAARVIVFDYVRPDGKDSRPWIYRDAIARDETDRFLTPGGTWTERELDRAVEDFYRRWWERKPGHDAAGPLAAAAAGAWSAVAGLMPFDEGPPRIPVFVPIDELLLEEDRAALAVWQAATLEDLYRLYLRPGWLAGRSQGERRRFLGLLERYVVPVPFELARQVAESHPGRRILRLVDLDAYDRTCGFGPWRQAATTRAGDGEVTALVDIW